MKLWKKGVSYDKVEYNMKKLKFMSLARLASFLALLVYFIGYYLSFTLFDFLPRGSGESPVTTIYLLNIVGVAFGAVVCPLFLSGILSGSK